MYARGYAMGSEFKGKGVNVGLGPMTNMGRVAAGGRNWEGFGGDPYLSGWATEMTVRGLQDAGVQATWVFPHFFRLMMADDSLSPLTTAVLLLCPMLLRPPSRIPSIPV
jgi:hypothetical protein